MSSSSGRHLWHDGGRQADAVVTTGAAVHRDNWLKKAGAMAVAADDKRVRRFVDLRVSGVARLSGLDCPERFLDEITAWCRAERRLDDPADWDELARILIEPTLAVWGSPRPKLSLGIFGCPFGSRRRWSTGSGRGCARAQLQSALGNNQSAISERTGQPSWLVSNPMGCLSTYPHRASAAPTTNCRFSEHAKFCGVPEPHGSSSPRPTWTLTPRHLYAGIHLGTLSGSLAGPWR